MSENVTTVVESISDNEMELRLKQHIDECVEKTKKQIENEDITVLDFSKTIIHGNEKQIKSLFINYSKFLNIVKNPKNTKTNPFHKSKYAPLDEVLNTVKKPLSECGLAVIQNPTTKGQDVIIQNILIDKEGGYITFEALNIRADKTNAQGIGGAITYARRYSLSAILGLSSEEDNDGNTKETKDKKVDAKNISELSKYKKATTEICKELAKNKKDPTQTINKVLGKKIASATDKDLPKLKELEQALKKL